MPAREIANRSRKKRVHFAFMPPGHLVDNIIISLLYAKMLKETEEALGFVVIILIIIGILIRRGRASCPPLWLRL